MKIKRKLRKTLNYNWSKSRLHSWCVAKAWLEVNGATTFLKKHVKETKETLHEIGPL